MNFLWRMAHCLLKKKGINKKIGRFFELVQFVLCNNSVSAKARIGKNTKFHHHALGCVVHEKTVIGEKCHIFQCVTLGSKWPNGVCEGDAPTIGNNVFIGAGAVVLGRVKIGNNVIIGANAVVTKDIPDDCIAVGVPAKINKITNKGK